MLRCLLLLMCACGAACTVEQPPLLAENVVVTRPIPGTSMGVGYMTLRNTSGQTIEISHVASPDGVAIAMHESMLEDGIARMYELQTLSIPARQSVTFEAGGKHLMIRYASAVPDILTLQFFAGPAMLLSIQTAYKD